MDNVPQNQQAVPVSPEVSTITPLPPQTPVVPPVKKGMGKNIIVIFSVIIIVLVIAGILYYYFSTNTTYNAKVYTPPTTAVATPTPTPVATQINKNDNSNAALDSDSNIIEKDINNSSSDLDSVDQSFSDEETNLQ